MAVVFCWRTGVIGFSRRVPKGALPLVSGPLRRLRNITLAIARHAHDGKTLLVPGVPEADTNLAALQAARRFKDELRKRLAEELG